MQAVIQVFQSNLVQLWSMIIVGIIGGIAATSALIWSKHPLRWILGICTVGVVLLVVLLATRVKADDLDQRLPQAFVPPVLFPIWILMLSLVALYASAHVVSTYLRAERGSSPRRRTSSPIFPISTVAWQEIQIRLSQAKYDTGEQKFFLILAPNEALAAALLRTSGLQFFAQAPVSREAPIHAYATADGLFLSCAGASSWGRSDDEGSARLVELCRRIRALNAEQSVLRGVATLYPMEKAGSDELLPKAGSLRNDLQTIQSELKVRCPDHRRTVFARVILGFRWVHGSDAR